MKCYKDIPGGGGNSNQKKRR